MDGGRDRKETRGVAILAATHWYGPKSFPQGGFCVHVPALCSDRDAGRRRRAISRRHVPSGGGDSEFPESLLLIWPDSLNPKEKTFSFCDPLDRIDSLDLRLPSSSEDIHDRTITARGIERLLG